MTIAGTNFDILDKALAARGNELYARPFITQQDYDEWMTGYNQLSSYASTNSLDGYVARQWEMEKKNYANAPALLRSKIRIADPKHYDTSISVSGNCDCGCSGNIPSLATLPGASFPSSGAGMIPPRNAPFPFSFSPLSVGDGARSIFAPNSLPFFPVPQSEKQNVVDKSQLLTGIIVAIISGVIFWLFHKYVTKK